MPAARTLFLVLGLLGGCFLSGEELPLPTGARLSPAVQAWPAGNFPLAAAASPDGGRIALLLCGWRQQGVQILDARSGELLQTLAQPAAFVGLAFTPDGRSLWASGGHDDALYEYGWDQGRATLKRRVPLGLGDSKGVHYPAGLAFSPDGGFLYVAENLGDALAVVEVASGSVVQRLRTDRYPYAVAVRRGGEVLVSAWGDHVVDAFPPAGEGRLGRARRIPAGRHPSALALDDGGGLLHAASASTDSVAVLDLAKGRILRTLKEPPPRSPGGSTPNALALGPGGRLFVAEADNNAVAVFDARAGKLLGRIPVDWYPSALALADGALFAVCAKGAGSGPNPGRPQSNAKVPGDSTDYTLGQLQGSVLRLPLEGLAARLPAWGSQVARNNGWDRARSAPAYPPFRHVVYVIKENRTYDQVFGDVKEGDGDPSLLFFGREVTPNHHALAERFGLYDRFLVNAEVSGDGHNWSTAAYATDYVEKTLPSQYSSRGRSYDFEGTNRDQLVDEEDAAAAPAAGYLWNLAQKKGRSLRVYGEFTAAFGTPPRNINSRRALQKVYCPDYPGFDLAIPDQRRADIWIEELKGFAAAGRMPELQIVHLPNDHTEGAAAGRPTPRAFVADNDLALGRMVEALSRSPFWKDTVLFVLEDDAQNGPDHVDSHRSPLLVISPYSRGGTQHRFANTTDVLATIEEILGLGTLTQFDHHGRPLRESFAATPDLRPYEALPAQVDLGERNPAGTKGAEESALLDFSRPDAVDDERLNRILWEAVKVGQAYPGPRRLPGGPPLR